MLTKYFAKLLTCVAPVLCALYLLLCPVPSSVPSSLPHPVLCPAPPPAFRASSVRAGFELNARLRLVVIHCHMQRLPLCRACHPSPVLITNPAPPSPLNSGRCQAKDKRRRNGRTPKQVLGAMFMFLLLLLLLLSFISFRFVTLPPLPPLAHSLLSFLFDAKFVFFLLLLPFRFNLSRCSSCCNIKIQQRAKLHI